MQENNKLDILDLDFEELAGKLSSEPSFRVKQIWSWLYKKGSISFDEMTNLSVSFRSKLADIFIIGRPQISKEQISTDGTVKWLMRLSDGNEVEAVYIPEGKRGTLCISSQVGCTLNCTFCHTGTQRMKRNLTSGEILQQILFVKDFLQDWESDSGKLTNIVLMGMGEPLLNYENVKKALKIAMNSDAMEISKYKITLSTSGIVPMIQKCSEDLGVNLAISLHATNDKLRTEIVPINKKYNIKSLLDVCKNYYGSENKRRKVTFEYVMLQETNDSLNEAKELLKLIKGIPAKINLIPFNPWKGTIYNVSSNNQIKKFARVIELGGYKSPVRTPRGQDIMAACGQLNSEG